MPWTSLARIPASAGRKQNLRGAVARVGSARRDEVSNSGRQRLDPEPKGRAGSTGPGRARRRPRGTHLARKAHDTGSLICPMNRAASAVGEAANSSATARTTQAVTDRVRPNLRACPIASPERGSRRTIPPPARVSALEDISRQPLNLAWSLERAVLCLPGGEKRRAW